MLSGVSRAPLPLLAQEDPKHEVLFTRPDVLLYLVKLCLRHCRALRLCARGGHDAIHHLLVLTVPLQAAFQRAHLLLVPCYLLHVLRRHALHHTCLRVGETLLKVWKNLLKVWKNLLKVWRSLLKVSDSLTNTTLWRKKTHRLVLPMPTYKRHVASIAKGQMQPVRWLCHNRRSLQARGVMFMPHRRARCAERPLMMCMMRA